MTNLFLVRHGRTIWHAENRYAGRTDVALDESGRAQAELLAGWARTAGLGAVWCSPLTRARETAEPAALAVGQELRIDPRLRELDFGEMEGRTMAEGRMLFAEALQRFVHDPVAHPMPGGEDPREAASRAVSALRELAAAHPAERVLVVAHNTLLRLAICELIGIPLATYRTVFPVLRNGALTEIGLDGQRAALLLYNAPLPSRL